MDKLGKIFVVLGLLLLGWIVKLVKFFSGNCLMVNCLIKLGGGNVFVNFFVKLAIVFLLVVMIMVVF